MNFPTFRHLREYDVPYTRLYHRYHGRQWKTPITIRTLRRQVETLYQHDDLPDNLFYPLVKFSKGHLR